MHTSNSIQLNGRVLVILCQYGAREAWQSNFRPRRLFNLLSLYTYRQFVNQTRDYISNPRQLQVMAQRLEALLEHKKIEHLTLEVRSILPAQQSMPHWADELHWNLIDAPYPGPLDYDSILIVYCDPLGLGWQKLERYLLQNSPSPVQILNSRRRLFRLTPQIRKKLQIRRFLVQSHVMELGMIAMFLPMSVILLFLDKINQRT